VAEILKGGVAVVVDDEEVAARPAAALVLVDVVDVALSFKVSIAVKRV